MFFQFYTSSANCMKIHVNGNPPMAKKISYRIENCRWCKLSAIITAASSSDGEIMQQCLARLPAVLWAHYHLQKITHYLQRKMTLKDWGLSMDKTLLFTKRKQPQYPDKHPCALGRSLFKKGFTDKNQCASRDINEGEKSLSINEFLEPAAGERNYTSGGHRRGHGPRAGGGGGGGLYNQNYAPMPKKYKVLEDPC